MWERHAWESDFSGFGVAHIRMPSLSEQAVDLHADLVGADIRFAYGFCAPGDPGRQILTAHGAFVPATLRAATPLHDGDRIEVVAPMQGG